MLYYINREKVSNMKTIFFCYPKCTTCQKAKRFLMDHKISFQERHIVEENPTIEELKSWYEKNNYPLKKFFNTSGNLYRELHLKEKLETLSLEEQLELLSHHGMLLKRPISVINNKILLGFDEKTWEAMITEMK